MVECLYPIDAKQLQNSKYCMLEILRHTFDRIGSVLLMRRLSRKFKRLSQDSYLDNFYHQTDPMQIRICEESHLDYLRQVIKYVNIVRGENCLHVDFYYYFKDVTKHPKEQLQAEYDNIIDALTSAESYQKLALGIDPLHAKQFPVDFF